MAKITGLVEGRYRFCGAITRQQTTVEDGVRISTYEIPGKGNATERVDALGNVTVELTGGVVHTEYADEDGCRVIDLG